MIIVVGAALHQFYPQDRTRNETEKYKVPSNIVGSTGSYWFDVLEDFTSWARKNKLSREEVSRPNVILISLDTLRADSMSCYGYPRKTTPYLDHLARHGVLFKNMYTPYPGTLPAHMSMFTGLYPHVHGANLKISGEDISLTPLNENYETLPQLLKKYGYRTAAWTGGGMLAAPAGFNRGFDHYSDGDFHLLHINKLRQIIQWLNTDPKTSSFVFIHTYQIHSPYVPPEPFRGMFDPGYEGWIVSDWADLISMKKLKGISVDEAFWGKAYVQRKGGHDVAPGMISERDLFHLKALYDENILYVDTVLSRFMAELIENGLMDNTMIVITSDHGEEFFEHGGYLHSNLYRETAKVPLIIFYPRRLPVGKAVTEYASLVDIPSTILELAGLFPQEPGCGRSLLSSIGKGGVKYPVLGEEPYNHEPKHASLRYDGYTLYVKGDHVELYDIDADPGERNNIAEVAPGKALSMQNRLRDMLSDKCGGKTASGENEIELQSKTLDQLRDLGYIR